TLGWLASLPPCNLYFKIKRLPTLPDITCPFVFSHSSCFGSFFHSQSSFLAYRTWTSPNVGLLSVCENSPALDLDLSQTDLFSLCFLSAKPCRERPSLRPCSLLGCLVCWTQQTSFLVRYKQWLTNLLRERRSSPRRTLDILRFVEPLLLKMTD